MDSNPMVKLPALPSRSAWFFSWTLLVFLFFPLQALATDNFYFVPTPATSSDSVTYQTVSGVGFGNVIKFTVVAGPSAGATDISFGDGVTVGLYNTATTATSPFAEPQAVYVPSSPSYGNVTTGPTAPMTFQGGLLSFSVTLNSGCNSMQVSIGDDSGSGPATTYPGTIGQASPLPGYVVEGFSQTYYLATSGGNSSPATYLPPPSTPVSTDLIISPASEALSWANSNIAVTLISGSSVTNSNCFAVTGVTGGYAGLNAVPSFNLWTYQVNAGPVTVNYEMILDYNGTLTDYNNPDLITGDPNEDTVYIGSATNIHQVSNPSELSGFSAVTGVSPQPFMTNGQVILRVWTTSAPATDTLSLDWASNEGYLSSINIPYSNSNVQPVTAGMSPFFLLDGSTNNSVAYTINNEYNSPISFMTIQIPVSGSGNTAFNVTLPSFLPGDSGSSLSVVQATSTAPGTITFNQSSGSPISANQIVQIPLTITCSNASNPAWAFPILTALSTTDVTVPSVSTGAVIGSESPPPSPASFTASVLPYINLGGGSVSLNWGQVTNDGATGYIVSRRSPTGSGAFAPVTTITSTSATTVLDSTVANLSSYDYTIVATNAVAQSLPVTILDVVPYADPTTITTLSALTGGTTVQLNWSAAPVTSGGYPIGGYQIWRDTQSSMATAVSITTVVAPAITYNDTTVTGGNHYYYELATTDSQYSGAVTGGPHISGLSSVQAVGFPLGNPPNSLAATLVTSSPATIQVSWTVPVSNLTSPVSYLVSRAVTTGASSPYTLVSNSGASVTIKDGAVTAGSYYVYTVVGIDGAGVTTNPAGPVTGFVGPAAPSSLHAAAGPAAVTLTWPAVPSSPGETVSVYNIYQNGTLIGTPVPAIPVTVTAIDNTPLQGINYTYQVTSVDTNGVEGAKSPSVTSALPPLVPQSFGVTVQQTGVSFDVAVTWSAPVSSANVTTYKIWDNPTNNLFGSSTLLATVPFNYAQPYVDDEPLANAGKTIFYWIKGVDPGGAGVSAIAGLQIPPNPPTSVTASPSSAAVTINWAAITGENVSKYTIYRAPLPSGTPVAVGTATPGTATSFTDSGPLTLGTNYAYYVTATDPGSGVTILGGESLSSVTVTAALLPPIPTGLTATLNSASDNVTLSWTSQLSGEPNLQSYTLSRTINAGAPATLQTATGSVVTYTDTGITSANAGQTILYYLFATNSAGGSSAQEGPVGLQVPPTPPGIPTPSASSSAITLNWTLNAGQNVSQYTIYRNSGSGFVSIGTAANPPFIDNGSVNGPLAYGSTYTYELTATNPGGGTGVPGGTSAFSASSAPWGLAPATPAGLAVSLLDNLNDTAFTWTGITDPSVTAVYALAATVNNPASAVTATLAAAAVSQYFAAQTGDATYYYWLEAVNPYGASSPAGPVPQLSYPAAANFLPVTLGPSQATVLSWVTVGKGDVTSYVESREVSGSNNFTQSQTITAAGLQLPVTLALPFTSGVIYDYEITAINATGTGPNSNLQPFSYLPTAPVSVTAVSGISNAVTQVNLSWSDPVSTSQGVTAFTVYKATAPAGPFSAAVSGLTGTIYSDSGAGVTGTGVYYYLIAADDNLGQESVTLYSNAVAVTAFALPNPPTAPSATAYNGSVTLSWTTVLPTTYPVSIYQIQRVGGGVTTILNSTSSPYGDISVANGVTYVYTLQTEDSQGNLSFATVPVTALPLAAPGSPQNPSAASGDSELLLTWSPGTPGTLPTGGYQIYKVDPTGPTTVLLTTTGPTANSYLDLAVVDGTTYSYWMTTIDNSGFTTGLHISANSVTFTGEPKANNVNLPNNLAAAAGVSQVILSWTDSVTISGAATVVSYSVYQEINSGGFVSIGSVPANGLPSQSVTETNLTNGSNYYYYLVASSPTTVSSNSATVLGIPAGPPTAPTPVIGTDGINQDVINWGVSPAEGSVTIKQYVITQAVLPGAAGNLATTAGSVTFYTDTNPANDGQTVVYQVEAVNSNGTTGVLSAPVTDYPYASFPVTITSHSAGTASVTLNFTQASVLSWAPLTQLDILRTPVLGGASVAITTGNLASPYIDSTATEGTLYAYTMEVVDSKNHTSVLSNAVTDGPSVQPAAPVTFVVTAGSQQVLLDWPASTPVSGAIPVSFYLLTINGAAPVTVPATQTWYLDSGLGNGMGVTVTLQAVDDSGVTVGNHASTLVGPVTVTTSQSDLNPPTGLTATAKTGSSVLLNWTLPNEEGYVVTSFDIYRSGSFMTAVGSPLATVNNPALAQVTSYTDNSASPGTTYYYVVQAVYSKNGSPVQSPNSNNAVVTTSAPVAGVPPVTVGVMAFNANLLKPLTGQQLGIYFVAPDSGPVELDVYNISGHPIRALYATAIADIAVNVTWDGKDRDGSWVASGIYLIEIKAPGLHQIKKVLVVK
jgi:fibronectin type 3 domain-containing protein